jgi:hypothetical protein
MSCSGESSESGEDSSAEGSRSSDEFSESNGSSENDNCSFDSCHVEHSQSRSAGESALTLAAHLQSVPTLRRRISDPKIPPFATRDQYEHGKTMGSKYSEDEDREKKDRRNNNIHRRWSRMQRRLWMTGSMLEACSAFATIFLCGSMLVWIALVGVSKQPYNHLSRDKALRMPVRERTQFRTRDKYAQRQPADGYASGLVAGFKSVFNPNNGRLQGDRPIRKRLGVEDLGEGCIRPDWQEFTFPTCNEVHAIDLLGVAEHSGNKDNPMDFVGQGLWRSVWAVDSADGATRAVLKMMKMKHIVDSRNLDRHRRDALVMERLTSSPYVVDIYSYCGNAVLSEYVGVGLDQVIYADVDVATATRKTRAGRIRLALDVAKGVQALHDVGGGPIVHADIQAKQFLVSSTGQVKINDFNRCRFVGHNNLTNEVCPFRIPTAPGKARAPEEYENRLLSEKLDIYSTANVFYGILLGQNPWNKFYSIEAKQKIQERISPLVPPEFRQKGTTDELLQNLTTRAYELDPVQRISASQLVKELERLL